MWQRIRSVLEELLFPYKVRYREERLKRFDEQEKRKAANRQVRSLKDAMRRSTDMRLRGCIRKVVYASREEAQCNDEISSGKCTPYKCPHCNQWHLTKRKP